MGGDVVEVRERGLIGMRRDEGTLTRLVKSQFACSLSALSGSDVPFALTVERLYLRTAMATVVDVDVAVEVVAVADGAIGNWLLFDERRRRLAKCR